MEVRQIPYCWEGRRVVASILESGGYSETTYAPFPLLAPEHTGTLEQVTKLGIVASLEEEPASTFYPWSAVLSMRLEE
jgi:hypothetical protein